MKCARCGQRGHDAENCGTTIVIPNEACGTFGCDEPAAVRTTRPHEWFPGWYCADHGNPPSETP